ncbi:Slp family lipoprotein [Thalassotalea fusca]
MRIIQIAVVAILVGLTACSTLPDKLQTVEGETLALYAQTDSQYHKNLGKQARWGGVIADVTNLKDKTMLEIVYFPLASSGRPKVKNETEGRFRAYFNGFLDPMVYKKGKSVTVLGRVQEKVSGTIGEHEYQYPVLASTYVHLWKEIQQVDVRIQHQPLWFSPYHWHHPYPYVRTPVIIKSSGQTKGSKNSDKAIK